MAEAQKTRDHDTIRQWVEERGGHPAIVSGTRSGDSALLRIDFDYDGKDEGLKTVEWDEFFRIFDENGLTFLYQEEKQDGERSTFNKFVNDNEA